MMEMVTEMEMVTTTMMKRNWTSIAIRWKNASSKASNRITLATASATNIWAGVKNTKFLDTMEGTVVPIRV